MRKTARLNHNLAANVSPVTAAPDWPDTQTYAHTKLYDNKIFTAPATDNADASDRGKLAVYNTGTLSRLHLCL